MREYRKKQRILKKTLNIICIFTAVFMFVYIGVAPFIKELWGMSARRSQSGKKIKNS